MNDTNVGRGMVPCSPGCGCLECQIERLRARLKDMRAENDVIQKETANLIIDRAFYIGETDRLRTSLEKADARVAELEYALRIIAGYSQCLDNLMSNTEVARAALAGEKPT